MNAVLRNRLTMAAFGGVAGICFYALMQAAEQDRFSDRLLIALALFVLTLFGGAMSMACAMPQRRALLVAAAHGLGVALLASWAFLRFEPVAAIEPDPIVVFSILALGFLPLPFFLAQYTANWRDYPAVFGHAWGLFLRLSFAWLFTGLVWGLIYVSDALFDLVGLSIIDQVLDIEISAWIITGVLFGLALAVVDELSDYMSPYLILQVMRLLVPFVLVVLVIFLVALPFRGINDLFGDLSSAGILLTIAASGLMLVTAAADSADDAVVLPGVMGRSAQGLGVVVVVPAALGAWAVGQRVVQYGWTPERLFAAWAAVFVLLYALVYAASVLRGGWRARIRQANVYLALGLIASAALWLTPILNPQKISTNSQMARFDTGGQKLQSLDLYALRNWGVAGVAAIAKLEALAKLPENTDLARALALDAPTNSEPADAVTLRASLAKIMPLQPNTVAAISARDAIFAVAEAYQLKEWQDGCDALLPGGQPGCVMVLADLRTDRAGDEVIFASRPYAQYFSVTELSIRAGYLEMRQLVGTNGQYPEFSDSVQILLALQSAPPAVASSPFNVLKLQTGDLAVSP